MTADAENEPTLAQQLHAATAALQPVTETPRVDAEILLAHALGIPRASLLARLNQHAQATDFQRLLERRLAFEPIAYILGEWEFFGLTLSVRPPMLVPRPETEHLVEAVLDYATDRPCRVLEIGTGTGCVAVAVAAHAPTCQLLATDVRPDALDLAQTNARRHGVADNIEFREGDLFAAVGEDEPRFDVICSNPPYVEEDAWPDLSPTIRLYEDPLALLAGKDGLDVIGTLVFEATAYLEPDGLLAFEIGMGQYDTVRHMLIENNYDRVGHRTDLAGIERVAVARKPAVRATRASKGPRHNADSGWPSGRTA